MRLRNVENYLVDRGHLNTSFNSREKMRCLWVIFAIVLLIGAMDLSYAQIEPKHKHGPCPDELLAELEKSRF